MEYQRHKPEETGLHKLVRENLGDFLRAVQEETGRALPRFVVDAWRSYLDCGVGGAGFRRLRCSTCLDEQIVCFSCKTRQLCPSCAARHMADGASTLVDKVIPSVPMRQYVLSLPFETWGVLGYRPRLMNAVQKAFIECVQTWHGERAKEYGFVDGKSGGVVVLHRFNSALGLQPHLHALLTDGVYTPDAVFHPFHAPDEAHLATLVERIATRVHKILVRAGVAMAPSDENDPLAACSREALQAGNRSRTDDDPPPLPRRGRKLAAEINGFNSVMTPQLSNGDVSRATLVRDHRTAKQSDPEIHHEETLGVHVGAHSCPGDRHSAMPSRRGEQ